MAHDVDDPSATMARCKRCDKIDSLATIRGHAVMAHSKIEPNIVDRYIVLLYEEEWV